MRPFRSSDDGSLYSLTAIYFLMSLCGAMTSLSISLHFAALHKGELLVASIFVSGACAQVFVVPLLSPLFNRYSSYRIAISVLFLDLLGLLAMTALSRAVDPHFRKPHHRMFKRAVDSSHFHHRRLPSQWKPASESFLSLGYGTTWRRIPWPTVRRIAS